MSYTTKRQPQGFIKSVEALLREGMIAEIVAINDYSNFISATDNKEVKDIFHHIMEEEKEHYGLFLEQLRKIDKEERELQEEIKKENTITSKQKYKESSSKSTKGNLLDNIREAIKGELEAIILYEDLIQYIEDKSIVATIKYITKDEKEHVEELTKALLILDKDEYGPLNDENKRKTYGSH
ncbi:ferritin-like domain-containing protein [Clostridium sp.]|uniref:ferritin-like domain-containing protein n=1 Tax=Clostridium sp. TaxID=1506 RepID=UPI002FC8F938